MPNEERQRLLNRHPSEENAATTVENSTHLALNAEQRSLAIHTHTIAADSAWRWWLQTGMHHSIADQLDKIRVPVMVIASPDDPVIPFEVGVVQRLPHAHLITFPEIGHLMPFEAPERLAQVIREQVRSGAIAS